MTIIIRCDNCGIDLFREDWQHRRKEIIYCHDCYNNAKEIQFEVVEHNEL